MAGTIELGAWAGKSITLEIQGTDFRGQVTSVMRPITVTASAPPPLPGLTGIASLPGAVLDFDGSRAVYATSSGTSARIRDLSSGSDTTIYAGGTAVASARLIGATSAAVRTAGSVAWEWNRTTLTKFGREYAAAGSRIGFIADGESSVLVRDPATSSTLYSYSGPSGDLSVFFAPSGAPNGDVVCNELNGSTSSLRRWRSGSVSTLATHGRSLTRTAADGVNVAYVINWLGGRQELLLPGGETLSPTP